MKAAEFDFPLPAHLIAKRPAEKRDDARLLVLRRGEAPAGFIEHRRFSDLPEYLHEGDMLLLNDTRVLPVRLRGVKPTGGRLDILLVRNILGNNSRNSSRNIWEILSKGRYTGKISITGRKGGPRPLEAVIEDGRRAELFYEGPFRDMLDECGMMPLPPYIRRTPDESDRERYQTVYAAGADRDYSIAAPTAGLHFTAELMDALKRKGVLLRYLTLHVGKGTFNPVKSADIEGHLMEAEDFKIEKALLEEIKAFKGRLIAVGTTATRAIEGFLSGKCAFFDGNGFSSETLIGGSTDIFIYPGGHEFRAVKGLITNFHLPRSTPLMLAAAFAGPERLLFAYREAICMNYRFFSYGDAMLVL